MHEVILDVVFGWGLVLHGAEPRHSFFTYVSCIWSKTSDEDIDAEVEFVPLDELWPGDVVLDDELGSSEGDIFLPFE